MGIYQVYHTVNSVYSKYNDVKDKTENVEKALETIKSVYDFSSKKDLGSYKKVIECMRFWIEKNPIGVIVSKAYEPHFKILFLAIEASGDDPNSLANQFDNLRDTLIKFQENSVNMNEQTKRPIQIRQSAYEYREYLTFENPRNNNIDNAVFEAIYFAKFTMHWLDKILLTYIPIVDNIVKLGEEAISDEQNRGTESTNPFEQIKRFNSATALVSKVENTKEGVVMVKGRLEALRINRNLWASWLGNRKQRAWKEYYDHAKKNEK